MKTFTNIRNLVLTIITVMGMMLIQSGKILAADHGDAPLMAQDAGSDIADVFIFLDPTDNSKVIIAQTSRGFIVPGESENLAIFDPQINYRLAIENTGDAASDLNINIRFSAKTGFLEPQIATVTAKVAGQIDQVFTAPTTVASATDGIASDPVITSLGQGVSFFAGMVDDPFFFDVPAELLYRASRIAGNPDPSVFSRGRDTFAGYNVLAIVFSIPVDLLKGSSGSILGFGGYTERAAMTVRSRDGGLVDSGPFIVIDRMGIPGINTVLIPYARKDEYNRGTSTIDAALVFASDLIASLKELLTDDVSIGILGNLAVLNGDYLRIDTSIPNTGSGGGTNPEAGFPNGRRPADDVIDTVVTLINNREPVDVNNPGIVDNVNANDKPFRDSFPFFAAPHQPLQETGQIDPTQN